MQLKKNQKNPTPLPKKSKSHRVFNYLEPLWTGEDGKISLKSCIAIVLTYKLIVNLDYAIQVWDTGKSLAEASSIFFTLAGLIAALLGITAWSNMTAKRIDTEGESNNVTIQHAENVTGDTKAEVVNTESIENATANTINNSAVDPNQPKETLKDE